MKQYIRLQKAREHNLKNIDLTIPRDSFIVITGPSGSGKSSLAFDTIYAEGQRRYIESLSLHARQYFQQMNKPEMDSIEGLSPTIAIGQIKANRNPRSTVGTVTEINDLLRLLFARIGHAFCFRCGKQIAAHTVQQMVNQIWEEGEGSRCLVLAPLTFDGRLENDFSWSDQLIKEGFARVRVDEEVYLLEELPIAKKEHFSSLDLVVDRLVIKEENKLRLTDSVEQALSRSGGKLSLLFPETKNEIRFSERLHCADCDILYPIPTPSLFSFNNPVGACSTCEGLGVEMKISENLVVPNPDLSIREGAIVPWSGKNANYYRQMLEQLGEYYGFDLVSPYNQLKPNIRHILLYGSMERIPFQLKNKQMQHHFEREFEGVIPQLQRRFRETSSETIRDEIRHYMAQEICSQCHGERLSQETRHFRVQNCSIADVAHMPLKEAKAWVSGLILEPQEQQIGEKILSEIYNRLEFLLQVGLHYLTLSRTVDSLSVGENQRIRLGTQIGSALTGVTYVLDEPTVGLHLRDVKRLNASLLKLRDLNNTVIVVEHEKEVIRCADYIIELGPGAGQYGGEVLAQGTLEEIQHNPNSMTGKYLTDVMKIQLSQKTREFSTQKSLKLLGARENNLKNLDIAFPVGALSCVTGVSGSGKSTLINKILYPAISNRLYHSRRKTGKYDKISGLEWIQKIVSVDQSPIGKSPRSNPATFTGMFDSIRTLFSSLPEAKIRGYRAGRFSFNIKGGRCEACQGEGRNRISMHFLPDVFVLCEACKGDRYNRETLEIKFKGKNIAQIMAMDIQAGLDFFRNIPAIFDKLKMLDEVGLGYLQIGQPSNTLSGGEAQRLKLAAELAKKESGKTLYLLDEPTTGLYFQDVERLLSILFRLVDAGNTVIVIEHNIDVIRHADYIVDLGPEGGDEGGYLVAVGPPEKIKSCKESITGGFL